MVAPGSTPKQRSELLAARGLRSWPALLGPAQAAALEDFAHVDVEATYSAGHFEAANFEGLMIEGAHELGLREGARYRVVGLLRPGGRPGMRRVGYNGPLLHPFEVEAVSHGRLVEHAGLTIRAHRSPGWLRDDGRGGHLESRQSRLDVLVGCSGDIVYVAVVGVLSRATEAFAIHGPCRDVWRELFPADEPPSLFHHRECIEPAPPAAAVPLPGDPAAALLALRERLLAGIQRQPNSCGADALLMAFTRDRVHCLRLGHHRVLRRIGSAVMPVLWEHNMRRYPPQEAPESELPEWAERVGLSSLAYDSPPGPVHSFPLAMGERWIGLSGGLFRHLSDQAVHGALGRRSPDEVAAWLAAEAVGLPDADEHSREWSLLVVDKGEPGGARPREAPAGLDLNSLLAQLHDLERNRG